MGRDTAKTRARFEIPFDSTIVSVCTVGNGGRPICKLSLLESRHSGCLEDGDGIFVAVDEHAGCCVQPKMI